ncbi:hypothetical protein [Ornithinicoccus hortensis]|uniref:Uncharacterized protein n=1 Tax=Ornithinicoccus hortensis TaxID=82346 RepID=A0A542YNG4_9MICO|nr:hypothetical protein [Ornithinicoccus hortensis]TQL49601.1 hypothetical protein FB467_0676 [Ornithinicoccus hortensis]
MKKTSFLALALSATVVLGACSSEDEPSDDTTAAEDNGAAAGGDSEDTAEDTGAAGDSADETGAAADEAGETEAAGSYADPACEEFFTEGGPLADRADAAREAITAGDIVDMPTYSEVNLLKQRIDATASSAPEDISTLLLEVNAPFAETVDAVNEGSVVDEDGVITLPEIDVQGSADAQAELETACAG